MRAQERDLLVVLLEAKALAVRGEVTEAPEENVKEGNCHRQSSCEQEKAVCGIPGEKVEAGIGGEKIVRRNRQHEEGKTVGGKEDR